MIDRMDQGIVRIISELKEQGRYENTLFKFLSDNGVSDEDIKCRGLNYSLIRVGLKGSYVSYKEAWSNVLNTPYRYYKKQIYEGGIASHDCKIRVKSSDDDQNIYSIKIYSNVPELEIFVDGKLERTIKVNRDHIAFFDFQPKSKNHIIEARAEINGKFVSDQLELCFLSSEKLLNDNFQNEIAVNIRCTIAVY